VAVASWKNKADVVWSPTTATVCGRVGKFENEMVMWQRRRNYCTRSEATWSVKKEWDVRWRVIMKEYPQLENDSVPKFIFQRVDENWG
jgi:hypothetical protein